MKKIFATLLLIVFCIPFTVSAQVPKSVQTELDKLKDKEGVQEIRELLEISINGFTPTQLAAEELDEDFGTPLMYACHFNYKELALALIAAGADMNYTNNYSYDALKTAIRKDNVEIAEMLIAKGANLDDESGEEYLFLATKNGNLGIVKALAERGVNLNRLSQYGERPLVQAAYYGYKDIVDYFLNKKNIDANTPDRSNRTGLMWAANGGFLEVVKIFVAKGAEINAVDNENKNALWYAVQVGSYVEVVQFLIDKGIDINLQNKDGFNPLMSAAFNGETALVKVLVGAGAKVNLKTNRGETALMLAKEANHMLIISILERAGGM